MDAAWRRDARSRCRVDRACGPGAPTGRPSRWGWVRRAPSRPNTRPVTTAGWVGPERRRRRRTRETVSVSEPYRAVSCLWVGQLTRRRTRPGRCRGQPLNGRTLDFGRRACLVSASIITLPSPRAGVRSSQPVQVADRAAGEGAGLLPRTAAPPRPRCTGAG